MLTVDCDDRCTKYEIMQRRFHRKKNCHGNVKNLKEFISISCRFSFETWKLVLFKTISYYSSVFFFFNLLTCLLSYLFCFTVLLSRRWLRWFCTFMSSNEVECVRYQIKAIRGELKFFYGKKKVVLFFSTDSHGLMAVWIKWISTKLDWNNLWTSSNIGLSTLFTLLD